MARKICFEAKEKPMKRKIKELAEKYLKAEKELIDALVEMNDGDCKCKDREIIRTVYEEGEPEITERCLNCEKQKIHRTEFNQNGLVILDKILEG